MGRIGSHVAPMRPMLFDGDVPRRWLSQSPLCDLLNDKLCLLLGLTLQHAVIARR